MNAAQPAPELTASEQPVDLEYQESPARIIGWRLQIVPRSTPFRNEPQPAGRKVSRGTIESAFRGVSGSESNRCINAPFLWDYTAGKLYLDLDRKDDLANAPVFSTGQPSATRLSSGQYYYQTFTNIHLTFGAGPDAHPRLADIHLYGYDGKEVRGGNLTWRCFWQGKFTLQNQEWQIGLVEDPNHLGTAQSGHLLLRPWNEREQPFSLEDGSLDGFECPTNLFFQGRAFRLTFDFQQRTGSRFRLELAETQAELGELVVQGKFIRRLLLTRHQSGRPLTVLLNSPEGATRLPVGTYDDYRVYLKSDGAAAFRSYRNPRSAAPSVSASNTTLFSVGGPLTNWVAVGSGRHVLALDYELRGADGTYLMVGNDRSKPPRFSIYQAGQKVGSGTFEYG